MRIANVYTLGLPRLPRSDIAIFRVRITDVELLALARLDIVLVYECCVSGRLRFIHADLSPRTRET